MCKWGTDKVIRVFMPAELSHTGKARWADKAIDACIAPIVKAMNENGIYTRASCCGHGKEMGRISLHDGRVIMVDNPKDTERHRAVLDYKEVELDGEKTLLPIVVDSDYDIEHLRAKMIEHVNEMIDAYKEEMANGC